MNKSSESLNEFGGFANQQKLAWQSDALCAQTSPEAFFNEHGGPVTAAKKVCGQCDVGLQCLHYALDNDERSGVFGGMTVEERDDLLDKTRQEIVHIFAAKHAINKKRR